MSVNQVSLSAQNHYINKQQPVEKEQNSSVDSILEPVEQTVVSSVAPARRIAGIPDMLKSGDTIGAAGIAALTLINLPEDCRDLKAAYNHSACALTRKNIPKAYDYKKFQHDFSFFRGTLLHEGMKKVKSERGKRIVDKLYSADKTLYNTKFGKWVQKILGIENGAPSASAVKDLWGRMLPVRSINVKNDFLGLKELTGRALKRTTVLGLAFMGLLELPKIIKSLKKGDNAKEKSKSFAIQTGKSSLNVLSVSAGMGYLGALGAKHGGALGSLVGMGLGAIAGAAASSGIQKGLHKIKDKD